MHRGVGWSEQLHRCNANPAADHAAPPSSPLASQGGQFLRAVAERCQHLGPRMHTLVTMGALQGLGTGSGDSNVAPSSVRAAVCQGCKRSLSTAAYSCAAGAQHQGVANVPGCWEPEGGGAPSSSFYCRMMQARGRSSAAVGRGGWCAAVVLPGNKAAADLAMAMPAQPRCLCSCVELCPHAALLLLASAARVNLLHPCAAALRRGSSAGELTPPGCSGTWCRRNMSR